MPKASDKKPNPTGDPLPPPTTDKPPSDEDLFYVERRFTEICITYGLCLLYAYVSKLDALGGSLYVGVNFKGFGIRCRIKWGGAGGVCGCIGIHMSTLRSLGFLSMLKLVRSQYGLLLLL